MIEKLEQIETRYRELDKILSSPEVIRNPKEFLKFTKERAGIKELVETFREYKRVLNEIEENKLLLSDEDEEMLKLVRSELATLKERIKTLEDRLKILLLPKDPNDEKNVILEIRAGTGGEEAALFCSDLFRMYGRYAERHGWRVEIMSQHPTGLGGLKEIIASIEGKGAYSRLKYESGVHRVQRIPVTEAGGRIHTSTVTVAVLPEAEEVEVTIEPQDIRIDVFRSSGPGGQSVNTTDSAVRITHLPTGMVVSCQDEKSQHKNKAKALKILRARLLDKLQQEQHDERSLQRRNQVGSGERSEKIRTYNFPQNRVTDHRIGLSLYKLERILDGELNEILDALIVSNNAEALKVAS